MWWFLLAVAPGNVLVDGWIQPIGCTGPWRGNDWEERLFSLVKFNMLSNAYVNPTFLVFMCYYACCYPPIWLRPWLWLEFSGWLRLSICYYPGFFFSFSCLFYVLSGLNYNKDSLVPSFLPSCSFWVIISGASWFDVHTSLPMGPTDGKWINIPAPLTHVPVFQR